MKLQNYVQFPKIAQKCANHYLTKKSTDTNDMRSVPKNTTVVFLLKGEFNLDIMSQSGYWSYRSVNNFHPLVVGYCTLVKKL